jgi:hypothetical protein
MIRGRRNRPKGKRGKGTGGIKISPGDFLSPLSGSPFDPPFDKGGIEFRFVLSIKIFLRALFLTLDPRP